MNIKPASQMVNHTVSLSCILGPNSKKTRLFHKQKQPLPLLRIKNSKALCIVYHHQWNLGFHLTKCKALPNEVFHTLSKEVSDFQGIPIDFTTTYSIVMLSTLRPHSLQPLRYACSY